MQALELLYALGYAQGAKPPLILKDIERVAYEADLAPSCCVSHDPGRIIDRAQLLLPL